MSGKRYGLKKLEAGWYESPSARWRVVRLPHEIDRRDGKPGYREIYLWEVVTAPETIEGHTGFPTLREAAAEVHRRESETPPQGENE